MADFKTRTPAIDPQAFANVLQRKAQMEQEQINKEIDRKNDRVTRLMNAVVTGQNIASNMMTIADKKNKLRQAEEEENAQKNIARLANEPTPTPTEEPSLDPKINAQRMAEAVANRERELMQNLALSGSREKYNESLLKKTLGDTDEAAGDTELRTLYDESTKQNKEYIINKRKGTVTTIGGSPVPKELAEKLLRGYAPKSMEDQFGNPVIVPAQPGQQPNSGSSAVMTEGGIPALQSTAPVLAERFVKARDQAYPASNVILKEAVDAGASAATIKAVVNQKEVNEVGLKSLGFHLARLSGSNSQLSDAEREQFESPLSFIEQMKNKGYRVVAGDLSPKMKHDLSNLSDLLLRKEKIRAHKQILLAKQNAKGQVGKSRYEKYNLDAEFPTVDELVASSQEFEHETANTDALIEDFFKNPR